MTRLNTELQRLFALSEPAGQAALATPAGPVRALVLGLSQPADWPRLRAVWQAVQQDLDLPAPAIAINGRDGLQLWFALAEPVPADQAQAFLQGLRQRHLGDVPERRVLACPASGPGRADPPDGADHAGSADWADSAAAALPGREVRAGQWSAFVAPDLAPVFADEPWLDLPPTAEGQAELLARVQPIAADAWALACQRLAPPPAAPAAPAVPQPQAPTHAPPAGGQAPTAASAGPAWAEPRAFLLAVMNDSTVDLALRIDAAKALLASGHGPRA